MSEVIDDERSSDGYPDRAFDDDLWPETPDAESPVNASADTESPSGQKRSRWRPFHRRSGRKPRSKLFRTLRYAVLAIVVVYGISFARYVLHDNGDTSSQRAVTWARDHHLGLLVNVAERARFSTPPSKQAATNLALETPTRAVVTAAPVVAPVATTTPPTTTLPTSTVAAPAVSTATAAAPSTVATTVAPTTTTTTTTTTIAPFEVAPAPLAPAINPPLDGEGGWIALAAAGATQAIWATSYRPLPEFPSVVASLAVIDQTKLRAGLFNGTDIPGGSGWQLGNRVPDELRPALMAAFNGGFRFEHIKGGYKTEGRVVRDLKDGQATLAISRDGKVTIGQYGRDLTDDGTWLSMRQNLPLIVDDSAPRVDANSGTWWGADYGNVIYVLRSSLCQLKDGRLMYAVVGKVDAKLLAQALVNVGCVRGMQLDINGNWPSFFTFAHGDDGARHGAPLDRRMGGNRDRYLNGSSREFVSFFDAAAVPPDNVLLHLPG